MQTTRSNTVSGGEPNDDILGLVRGESVDPHRTLGAHPDGTGRMVVRVLRPEATAVWVLWNDEPPVSLRQIHPAGLFEGHVAATQAQPYRLQVEYGDRRFELEDPYRFWPTLGELDLHLIGEGRHLRLWDRLGAHLRVLDGVAGTSFAVWAPNARSVRVVGDFNSWDGRLNPMRELGSSGVWELFVPGVEGGARYKYELVTADGSLRLKADPLAFAAELAPQTASIVYESAYQWGDEAWLGMRAQRDQLRAQMSIYEVHLGSWRQGRTYRQLATELVDYVDQLGFTHVELLPIAEHPFGGSWGYQVTGYYAPTTRYGTPDDFRALVDAFHQRGIGVIIDWVPAHFPKDDWALARFDGTPLYEHADPRRGEHPDWGSLVFNLGRNEVRNFLLANALYWVEEFHIDALRVDAVASMLYLDYSRKAGEWIPNIYGGNEDLDAVSFLRECNIEIYGRNPGCFVIAEESTAWPGVSRPAYLGGLGFGFKWNMGWMHDTLSYFSYDPIYRRYHHNELTFSLLYAFSENYILPLSHDEVVHGKGSLIAKMPGDDWQKFANLRALYGYMWAHPGKQLLFMGDELGQRGEWRHDGELDFETLADPLHRGVQELVRDLNRIGRTLPALWERDCEAEGFRWIEANDPESNVIAFLRYAADGSPVMAVANLSPVPRLRYRFGLPVPGVWREALNTDASAYGGAGMGNLGKVEATTQPWNGLPASAELTLPPLATIWLLPT